jgi:hypothetical protein
MALMRVATRAYGLRTRANLRRQLRVLWTVNSDRTHLPGLTRATETAPDITDYTDFEPIVSTTTERGGDFLVLVRFSVTNTGAPTSF